MRAETQIFPYTYIGDVPVYAMDFTVRDMYIFDADENSPMTSLAQMKQDDSIMPYEEVPGINWTGVPSKSIKACTNFQKKIGDDPFMSCTYVNCHYYRNFWTKSSMRDTQPF